MSYAVIATFKLPETMGGAEINELVVGRFNQYESANDEKTIRTTSTFANGIVKDVLDALQGNLGVKLFVTFHVRAEG